MPARLTDSQRALRKSLRRARPLRRRVSLPELDAYYLAECLRSAEPAPVTIIFRGVDGATALAAVAGIPIAHECFRKGGITPTSTVEQVRLATLARFADGLALLARDGIQTGCCVDGDRVLIGLDNPLLIGVPLTAALA